MTITPESFTLQDEDSHQLALQCWAALHFDQYPDLKWLHHSPNGGFRNKREAVKLKAMGVKPGFPDLALLVKRGAWSGLLIELKHPREKTKKDGGARPDQLLWGDHLHSQGFGFKVCHGWEEARDLLIMYLEWR